MPKGHGRKGNKGCKFHPSRTSGRQKLLRQMAWDEYKKKKAKAGIKSIDTGKSDWSSEA